MMDRPSEYTETYFLCPSECNAQREMSLPMLTQCLINISTAHADRLGVGYRRLLLDNHAWVLTRLSIDMDRMPSIDEPYSLTTWLECMNRHYSERIVEVRAGKDDRVIGYGRLIWMAIDMVSRRPTDLSSLLEGIPLGGKSCPLTRSPRLKPVEMPDFISSYQFRFSDIDFNRHVNSTRYVEFMLDQWGVDFFDRHRISHFDIAYQAEAHFEDVVEVRRKGDDEIQDFEIAHDGNVCTRARIHFSPRQ